MSPRFHLVLAAALAALVVAAPARGTTVLRQSVATLTERSSAVVTGTVESLVGHDEAHGHPFRLARVRVSEVVAGMAPAVVAVRLPGGTDARGGRWLVPGAPDLAVGDEVLLFLEKLPVDVTSRRVERPAAAHAAPGARGVAAPDGGPAPAAQWVPVSLAVGAYRVVREGGDVIAVQDAAARGMRLVGEPGGADAPARAPLGALLAAVRSGGRVAP